MKNLLLPILFVLLMPFAGKSQVCNVFVTPLDTVICPGDSILVTALASMTSGGQQFNFNFGVLPPGWSTSGGSTYGQPCGSGSDGTSYYWASTAGSGTPQINSPAFDVGCGGSIDFDMVYSIQGQAAPCEGPDLANEGVSLQYSIDGGVTWIDIIYYSPGGYTLPANPGTSGSVASGATPYTTWGSFSVPIPPGAMTANTQFQWIQINSSGSSFDNWGIDNIVVAAGPCNSATVDWDSDGMADSNQFWVAPLQDTIFVADVYDTNGVYQCSSDTINVTIYQNTMTYDVVDTLWAYCPTDSLPAEVLNFANAPLPYSVLWSNGDTTDLTMFGTNGNKKDTIYYYVEVTDVCGYTTPDTVVMIVNQTLEIDTMIQNPASACLPDGWVSATVVGATTTSGQPFYHWEGPGIGGPYQIDGTVMTDIPTGWYHFSVVDDVCEEHDSIFVDITNPPIADFSPPVASGCGPLDVSFVNASQNVTNYEWNFGDGSAVSTDENPTHSFTMTSTVMLIASDNSGCADTAYASITVEPCGCTDPSADNYNPMATIDDGSCIYPYPTVSAPNVFTPNGDESNDLFFLKTTNATEITLIILNRWGNVMYEQTGPNPAWDGNAQSGAEAEEGTYFYKYIVKGVLPDNTLEGHGFLQLQRD
jgi:gliding motility-associated-like protein